MVRGKVLDSHQEPWAARYYHHKRQEGKTHSLAVRALANAWVRIIHTMWLKHESYHASIFMAARQAHGPRAA